MIFSWFFPPSIYSLSRSLYHFSLLTLQSTLKSIFHLNIILFAVVVQLLSQVSLHGLQHARFLCPPLCPNVCSNSCPLSCWCYLIISSSAAPFSSSIFPSIRVFSNDLAFCIRWPKYWSFGIIFPVNIQGWSPCCLRDSQDSPPAPQFESICSSALSLL